MLLMQPCSDGALGFGLEAWGLGLGAWGLGLGAWGLRAAQKGAVCQRAACRCASNAEIRAARYGTVLRTLIDVLVRVRVCSRYFDHAKLPARVLIEAYKRGVEKCMR